MGKIFYIMGKSSSGKDSIYRKLESTEEFGLKRLVIYTTRPIRDGAVSYTHLTLPTTSRV